MGEWNGKYFFLAAIALVAGLVIGGLGPRSDVRELRDQVATLEARKCNANVGRRIFGEVLQSRAAAEVPPDAPVIDPVDPGDEATPRSPDRAEPEIPRERDGVDPGAARMKDALEVRRAQALAALREQAEASDGQMAEVDALVSDMNADLGALAEDFVASVEATGEPSRRETMLFAADALDILIGTEDALVDVVGPERAAELSDEALDPTAYVDGSVVDILSRLDR